MHSVGGGLERRRPVWRLRRVGRIILKRIFKKCIGRHRPGCSGSVWGHVAGACECGSEPSGLIKCGKFSDWLRTCWLLRKDSVPWS